MMIIECVPAENDSDDVAHRSDDEEADVMSAVAAIATRDAQLEAQLHKRAPDSKADGGAVQQYQKHHLPNAEVRNSFVCCMRCIIHT